MLPRLRAAVADLSIDEVARLAAEITLPEGPDKPAVLTAVRLAVLAPEPGDGPHSSLVAALAPWTAGQARTASADLCVPPDGSSHPEVWVALGHELAAAGGVEAPAQEAGSGPSTVGTVDPAPPVRTTNAALPERATVLSRPGRPGGADE